MNTAANQSIEPTSSLAPLVSDAATQRLTELLLQKGLLDERSVERAQLAAERAGEAFHRVLSKLGLLAEGDLLQALSEIIKIPIVSSEKLPVQPILPETISAEFVRFYGLIPLSNRDGQLCVAVTDPFNSEPVDALSYLMSSTVRLALISQTDFEKVFQSLYGAGNSQNSENVAETTDHFEHDVQRLKDIASEAPIIKLVNQVIADAVDTGASDIHFEPTADSFLVRYRIDGLLRTSQHLSPSLRAAVTSRIKIMGKLDIAERRLPQDGRVKAAVRGIEIDFRISTLPTMFGESVVLRILDRSRVELEFEKLGFLPGQIAAFRELIAEPNGIILVTGPTGSGKTTTLYTALRELNSETRKVLTVEDPIEYQFAGINQVQVHASIGFDFPKALRSILRQDPDVIMIGEIRDFETAQIAIQSSLTGHLVLSTLHTNNAASAATRLIDMGVEDYLLASTVRAIAAQRLVRKLCEHCSREHQECGEWARILGQKARGIQELGLPNIRAAVGCAACGRTGYAGRSTVAELLLVGDEFRRELTLRRADSDLDKIAQESGMLSMFEVGAYKVWRGETSVEELFRVTKAS
jgi:general secretion pathway protein E